MTDIFQKIFDNYKSWIEVVNPQSSYRKVRNALQSEIESEPNFTGLIEMWDFFFFNCINAKGSSHNHQAWSGGYFDHISEVFEISGKLLNAFKDRNLPFTKSDVLIVLFLHDIEKPIKYSNLINSSEFNGKSTDEIRSYLIEKYKIVITDAQKNALKYIHGEGNDYSSKERVMNELAGFCHCCDVMSARVFHGYPI